MRRLWPTLIALLGLSLVAAAPVSAAIAASIENCVSGLPSGSNNLIGIEPRLRKEAVSEKVALAYELASDDAVAARGGTTVIGKLDDLKNLAPGERTLLNRLPNLGSPKANWHQNSGVLRQEMGLGRPIRDATVDSTGALINNTGFLRAERYLMESRGWTFDPRTTLRFLGP